MCSRQELHGGQGQAQPVPLLSAAEVFQGGDEEGRGPEREGPHQQADPHPGGDHDRAQRPLSQGAAQRRGVLQTSRG